MVLLSTKKDDLDDSDIMAYSGINNEEGENDDSMFSSGGAIMDALAQNDPSFK